MTERLLVVTGLWPSADRPSAGIFVQRRLEGVSARVIGPRSYRGPMPLRYAALMVRALTARGRFDCVEAHGLFPAGLIALLAARLRRVPLIVYAHGSDVRETAQANAIYRRLARRVARQAAAVVTNSKSTAEWVRRLGRDPLVIPPGVDRTAFSPTPRRSQKVLYLGGLDPRKGYAVARELAHTLVGPGLVEVNPDDIPELMAEHDVVLIPSTAEPFGLVAAEAICSGRWVVASDVDGLREVVTAGVNGTLVGDGDFRRAIAQVPDYDPFDVAQTGERFDWSHHRVQMAALHRQLQA